MDTTQFSLKELYDVVLKATYPMDINGIHFDEGDIITKFDRLQLANFSEIRSFSAASGGLGNLPLVTWDDLKEVPLYFNQGIFSKLQMAMLNNLKIVDISADDAIEITQLEEVETFDLSNEDYVLFALGAGVTKIRVYVWVEGQDADCINEIAGGLFNVDLYFSLGEIPADPEQE